MSIIHYTFCAEVCITFFHRLSIFHAHFVWESGIFLSVCDDFASQRDYVTRGNVTVTKPCHGTKIISAPVFYFRDEEGEEIPSCNFTDRPLFIILLKNCLYGGGYNYNFLMSSINGGVQRAQSRICL